VSINLKNCFSSHNVHLSFQVCSTATFSRAPVLSRRDLFPVNSTGLTKRFPMSARNRRKTCARSSLFQHTICIAPWKVFLESGITRLPFGPVLLSQPRPQWRCVSHRLPSPSECLCFCSRALSPQRGSACRSATWREPSGEDKCLFGSEAPVLRRFPHSLSEFLVRKQQTPLNSRIFPSI